MPSSVLTILAAALNPSNCISITGGALSIKETGKQATLKSVSLFSVGTHAIGIKFDLCGFPGDKIFLVGHEMHMACDAIIFCQFHGEGYVLCCELKSSEPTFHEAASQFRSAHCFTDYVNSILKNFHHLSIHSWKRRYFLFHDAGKTPLKIPPLVDRTPVNDHPEKALFIPVQNGQNIYLRKLLGKPL